MATNIQDKYRALSNLGEIFVRNSRLDDALRIHNEKLSLAKQSRDKKMEADAYNSLGLYFTLLQNYSKALAYHIQV